MCSVTQCILSRAHLTRVHVLCIVLSHGSQFVLVIWSVNNLTALSPSLLQWSLNLMSNLKVQIHRNIVSGSKNQNSSSKKVLEILVQRLVLQDWSLHSWDMWSPYMNWSIVSSDESICVHVHMLQSYTWAEHRGGFDLFFFHKHIFSCKADFTLCLCETFLVPNYVYICVRNSTETISRYTILYRSFSYHL